MGAQLFSIPLNVAESRAEPVEGNYYAPGFFSGVRATSGLTSTILPVARAFFKAALAAFRLLVFDRVPPTAADSSSFGGCEPSSSLRVEFDVFLSAKVVPSLYLLIPGTRFVNHHTSFIDHRPTARKSQNVGER